MLADNPDANPARARELALDAIGLDANQEDTYTALHRMYNQNPLGHREAMTCYNLEDPKKIIKLTFPMLRVWSNSIVRISPLHSQLLPLIFLFLFGFVCVLGPGRGWRYEAATADWKARLSMGFEVRQACWHTRRIRGKWGGRGRDFNPDLIINANLASSTPLSTS